MAWEENPRICLHMQLIAILSRTGVWICKNCMSEIMVASEGYHFEKDCDFVVIQIA